MKRLLLYVHFNKYNRVSSHVLYQLNQLRPLFSKIVVISNSPVSDPDQARLRELNIMDDFIQRDNVGFDFAAWRDGMSYLGYANVKDYDSVTIMNDTCFGPLWDMTSLYHRFEADDETDFWGMTNNRATSEHKEHIQSYFISFKQSVVSSERFMRFWAEVEDFTDVAEVIAHYETQVTTSFLEEGFRYKVVFDTTKEDASQLLHADFSYYHPTAILQHQVPLIKVKTIGANQHITPYLLQTIQEETTYPVDKIVSHMSDIDQPDLPYLLGQKYLPKQALPDAINQKIAVHLHVFYVDLLPEFLSAFADFHFPYDLFITTDNKEKEQAIDRVLQQHQVTAQVFVTGNIGRDVLPMLKLKEQLENYDYVGHFHTKKSKEADFWAGESWRKELLSMMAKPADSIIANFIADAKLGLVIADIPSFFRYNKIVDAWNEHLIAPEMNRLWAQMGMTKAIDFEQLQTFVMSYGTFIWFKYEALKPLFDLGLSDKDVPKEPLPQNSVLHAIERLLIYIAWDGHYDFKISENPLSLSPFIDNKVLNLRGNTAPQTFVNFDHMGGIKGALKYIVIGPARAVKYIVKKLYQKVTR